MCKVIIMISYCISIYFLTGLIVAFAVDLIYRLTKSNAVIDLPIFVIFWLPAFFSTKVRRWVLIRYPTIPTINE